MSLRELKPYESAEDRTFRVYVNHMKEYQELLETAKNQLEDLNRTLKELERLDIKMDISF